MSFKDKMKEFGGGDIAFLSQDGETIKFMVVGDPELLVGEYKGKPSRKVGIPIVTEDGLIVLVAGMRLARKIAKHEEQFADRVFMAIRHGVENDANATYELQVLDDTYLALRLNEVMRDIVTPENISAAFADARGVVEK
jgi:hypothetical protein